VVLAFGAFGLAVGGVVWTALHGGNSCLWLHHLSRLAASILLLMPTVTLARRRLGPLESTWGPYALVGLALVLVAGVGRLYEEKRDAAWSQRDPALLLEASLVGALALLAMTKVGATAAAMLIGHGDESKRSQKGDQKPPRGGARRWWDRPLNPSTAASGELSAPLLPGDAHVQTETSAEVRGACDAPSPTIPVPLDRAGLWSRLAFGWVGPLLRTGARQQLDLGDVPALAHEDGTEHWARRFETALEAERGRSRPSLLRAAFVAFGADFSAFAGLQLINDLLGFSGPVLLKLIVNYVQDSAKGGGTLARGYTILIALLLTCATTTVLSTQYNLRMARLQLRVRTSLVAAIYAQVLRCRATQLGGLGSGEVTNLISLDVQRVQDAASSFNQFWSLPVQVALTLYLLFCEVSFAFAAGLTITALMVPLNMSIAKVRGGREGDRKGPGTVGRAG
jgi:hypothetical protein